MYHKKGSKLTFTYINFIWVLFGSCPTQRCLIISSKLVATKKKKKVSHVPYGYHTKK